MATASKTKEIGTLIVVVLKARNLPDKHTFTKQDPYTVVQLGPNKQQTQIDKRGGQHPVWDEDLHLKVLASDTKENRTLKVSCYAKESKEDELVGAGEIDITGTLTSGEFDDWLKLEVNGVQRGEIYLEMTYFAAGPPALARRASKLNPSERLWRPPETPPKTSTQVSPYGSPARHPIELGAAEVVPSRPTHLAPPRSSHSQSPTRRNEPPLPPVPNEVPASLRPAPLQASSGNLAHAIAPSKTDAKPIPASLRPGGPGRPAGQMQRHSRTNSVPTSPTRTNQIPAYSQQPIHGPHPTPSGYTAPTQLAYVSPLDDEIARPAVSPPPQPVHTPPPNQHTSLPHLPPTHQQTYGSSRPGGEQVPQRPPTSAPNQPVYPAPHPPASPFDHPPASAPNHTAYLPHRSSYGNTTYPSVTPYPNINPSYDPPPLTAYSTSPPPATAPAIPVTSPGSLHLSFPEPSINSVPTGYAASHRPSYPTESEEERQRRLASRYSSPMPLPPDATPPAPPPKQEESHAISEKGKEKEKSPSPSPKYSHRPLPKSEEPAPPPFSTSPTPVTTELHPTHSRVPESYLEKERAALERKKQEEADAELARRLAAEAELESSRSRAIDQADEELAARLAAEAEAEKNARQSVPAETDEEMARRLARELNSDVLEQVRHQSKDEHGHMPGGW